MACTRDRIINYLNSLSIDVNIGKNKAGGNNGFFRAGRDRYRIDVAKGLSKEAEIKVLVHEFAHYVHYCYDKNLKDLSFIFRDLSPELMDELISVTVESVNRDDIKPLFIKKDELSDKIKTYHEYIESKMGKFSINKPFNDIEKCLKKSNYRYLLKYDRVKVRDAFGIKIYSVDELEKYELEECVKNYLLLKSAQRMLRRINSRISRLNRYYNNPSELFSRAIERYVLTPDSLMKNHKDLYNVLNEVVESGKIEVLTNFIKIL